MPQHNLSMPRVLNQVFAFNGGLDQVTPPIEVKAGVLRASLNFEVGIRGGYSRVAGYERFNGKARPSAAEYAVIPVASSAGVAVGATITNDTGTASGKVIALEPAAIVITQRVGVFQAGTLRVGGVAVATATAPQMVNGASTPKLGATYRNLAADVYRALIGAVPGSGRVLGVHQYNGKVYAVRNNAAGTAAVMHVATAAGWSPIALGRELKFKERAGTVTITVASPGVFTWTAGGPTPVAGQRLYLSTTGALPGGLITGATFYVVAPAGSTFQLAATPGGTPIVTTGTQSGVHTAHLQPDEIADGATVTGSLSGASAVAKRVALSGGEWNSDPSGAIIVASVTGGAFVAGEALLVGGKPTVNVTSPDAAITLLPGGRYQFRNYNFGGQLETLRMYGVDGVNRGFEFDGETFVPISTGMTVDVPENIAVHKNQLFYSFRSSVQHSGVGTPHSFNVIFGAAELACGDTVTGMLVFPGADGTGALALFTTNSTSILYGNNSSDWNLIKYSDEAGGYQHTMQYVRDGILLDTQGITTLSATQNFGNFQSAAVSDLVGPYLADKITLATASCKVRKKNQYRLFFSSGDALYVTYSGNKIIGMMPIYMPKAVACISSAEGATGMEEIYFGAADGFVYQMEVGTSFDGLPIDANLLLAYNHFGGPRQLKRFRKTAIEVSGQGYAEFGFSTSLAYGSKEFATSAAATLQIGATSINYWDEFTFDQFYWDGDALLPAEADTVGTAENISLIFSSSSAEFDPFTLTSAVMHYTPQRALR